MKKIFFLVFRKIVFLWSFIYDHYWMRFQKEYYTYFLKKKSFKIGTDVFVNGRIKVNNYRGLTIGNNVHIGGQCFFHAEGGITIGDNTHISRNVTIYSANHNYTGTVLPYDHMYSVKSVIIECNVWVGMNVSIAPGVRIGEGAIIGIGAVINRNVKKGEIVVNSSTQAVAKRNIEHYENLLSQKKYGGRSGYPLTLLDLDKYRLKVTATENQVFILSTGRSGSNSLASILNQHPNVLGLHEPNWQLVKLSTEYQYGIITEEELTYELKALYDTAGVVPKGNVYVESDQKISNLVESYLDLFPNAKFIWLIRRPETFTRSAYARGWFEERNTFSNKGRLLLNPQFKSRGCRIEGDQVGEMSSLEWSKMDRFEKCAWYWNYWNEMIENKLHSLPREKWMMVKLEEVNDQLNNIMQFLEISEFDFKVEVKNRVLKDSKSLYDKMKNLNDRERDVLRKHCSVNIKKWFNEE